MSVRSISVRLAAEVGNYVQGFQRARAATSDLVSELSRSEQQRQNWQLLGTTMTVAGAAIAGGLGLAAKAAVDWETAWAGVVKTVDGSEEQLSRLEAELREMARTLPQSHAEIAAVAEAAGQLGVATDDVAGFTRTMIDLGVATNMTAEEAAFAVARMANIMGTATSDVDKLGATLVDLGNNSATTESEILQMALRISGAGATIGLAESEVLGFAAALSSVGVNAQAGGSAISRAMISIEGSVRSGGAALDNLARVAGMTSQQFADAYRRDAARAVAEFVAGLGRMQASGEDVFAVLDQLGFSEIRLRDALLRLASSGDLLTDSLDRGTQAWGENLALAEEAERRYDTTAAKMQVARNQLTDFAITLGETFLPLIGEAADKLGGFAEFLGGLPPGLLTATAAIGGVTAAVLLLGGTAITAVTRIAAYKTALDQLAISGGTTAAAVGRVNRGLRNTVVWGGRALGAIAALQIAGQVTGSILGDEFTPQLDAMAEGVARFGREGAIGGEAARLLGDDFEHLAQALRTIGPTGIGPNIGNAIKSVIEWTGLTDDMQGSLKRSREQIDAFDQSLAMLVTAGRMDDAAAAFDRLTDLAAENGVSIDRLKELLPAYAGALETAEAQSGDTADQFAEMGDAADEAANKVDALKEAFDRLFDVQMDIDRATLAYHQGLADLIDTVDDGTRSLDVTTQAGRDNRRAVLDQVNAINDLREANIDAGMSIDEANEKYQEQMGAIADLLVERGFEEESVWELIDAYRHLPSLVSTVVETVGVDTALSKVQSLQNRLATLNGATAGVHVNVATTGRNVFFRRGGIHAARSGLLSGTVVDQPTVIFGERGTGREAFIPRDGIPQARGLHLADTAARWHGGRVVKAGDGASLGGPWQWRGQRPSASAPAGIDERPNVTTTYQVFPQRADFTIHDLDALQRRQDALARLDRPR